MIKKLCLIFCFMLISTVCYAENIAKNTAKMQAMDKITGRVSVINVPVNGEVKFGSLSIVVRSCKTRPAEETPDNFAFADITDKTLDGDEINIFKGWMISSSPATHAVEHPIYDVWLLQCIDGKVDKAQLLNEDELRARDMIAMQTSGESAEKDAAKDEIKANLSQPIDEIQAENTENEGNPLLLPVEFSYDEEETAEDEEVSGEPYDLSGVETADKAEAVNKD